MKRTTEAVHVEAHKHTLEIRALDCSKWLERGHRPVSQGCGYLRCIDCNETGYADSDPKQCEAEL